MIKGLNRYLKDAIIKNTVLAMAVTVVVTVILTIGGVYLMGFHHPHTITVTDPESGEEKALWTCGMHPWIVEEEPGLCPICNMKLTPMRNNDPAESQNTSAENKIAYWRAPMNPMETYDKPGKSAMGMDLVPVYEDEVKGGVDVSIDPVTQQNMGIRTAVVKKGILEKSINTYGHVTYDETRTAQISPKINGWIEKIHADFKGKHVKKNEALFEIYSPDLVAAQEEFLSALKRTKAASRTSSLVQSARRRLRYFDVSETDIKRLEKTGQVRKTITLRSPFSGVVTAKNAEQGSFVKAGTTIFKIADLSRVWVEVHVYEYELPWVKKGQTAEMTLPYQPGKTFTGKVSFIYPYLQPQTRDVVVRLEFENPGLSIKPDMYADVKILTSSNEQGLIIPSEAVIRSGKRNVVFVTRENNKFSPRDVTLGVSLDHGNIQVLTGIAPGESVVTSGQFMLDSESKLKEAIQKMMDIKSAKQNLQAEEHTSLDNMKKDEDAFFSDME